jgi:hypothetical protein
MMVSLQNMRSGCHLTLIVKLGVDICRNRCYYYNTNLDKQKEVKNERYEYKAGWA